MAGLFRWSLAEALWRHRVVWTVLFFSTGIKGLVNQIEQPFARSLVACDVPLPDDVYTGSVWCGDRYKVIEEGMYLSGMGQGQEHFAMLCSLTFVVVITGIWGPKTSLLLGLTGVTISVVLFMVASTSPALGRSLFAMGQGLQGLYPIEYLQGILMLHAGMLPQADGQANWEIMGYLGLGSNLIWNVAIGNLVQLLELSNYFKVWTCVFALNVAILSLVLFAFPQMKPLDAGKFHDEGPFTKVFREVQSYWSLIFDWRARRYLIHKVFESMVYPFEGAFGGYFMAWHNWSQPAVTWIFFWPTIIQLFAMPLWPKLEARFGNYNCFVYFVHTCFALRGLGAFVLPRGTAFQIFFSYSTAFFSGFMAKRGFVDSRFCEPEQMQRFQSAQWVMGYFMGMWMNPFYGSLFDASASTYFMRVRALILYPVVLFCNWAALFYGIWDIDGVEGCGVSLRVLDEGGKKGFHLWSLVAEQREGHITVQMWDAFDLGNILEVEWWTSGGYDNIAVPSFDHFIGILQWKNSTPKGGQDILRRLDWAIAKANEVIKEYNEALANGWVLDEHGNWHQAGDWFQDEHGNWHQHWHQAGENGIEKGPQEKETLEAGNREPGEVHKEPEQKEPQNKVEAPMDSGVTLPAPEGKKDA